MNSSRKLRIFYASDSTANPWSAVPSNIWRNNLYLPLLDLGHEVVEFDYDWNDTFRRVDTASPRDAEFIAKNRPLVSAELLRQIRAVHESVGRRRGARPIDLFFSYFYDACVAPAAIDEIRGMGIKTVNWFCNGSYQLRLVKEISPHYDWCLVPEKFRLKDYEAMGARPIYCQEAANPAIYKPCEVVPEYDVTFVGQAYGDRPLFIKYLLKNGINVHVWGHGWRNPHPRYMPKETYDAIMAIPEALRNEPLSDDEMIRMYSRSRINLGFSTCGDTHLNGERILQVRLRDFEVPMSGGFYLVERMEELAEFFAMGREVECYSGREELLAKIVHYLGHEQERAAVARAGRERALREHTWQRRFEEAFAVMGMT